MPAPTFNDGLAKGRNASGAISKGRAVIQDTAATDGESVLQASSPTAQPYIGVSKFSVSASEILKGKGVTVITEGRALVEAGSALNTGDRVSIDSSGRAIVASNGDYLLGVVDEPASALGKFCSVFLADPGVKA